MRDSSHMRRRLARPSGFPIWGLAALLLGVPPARGDVVTGADWTVRFNRPDQTTTLTSIGPNEFDVRDAFVERIEALQSGDVGYLATYTLSGSYAENGAAGPILAAVSNALARGAKMGFVVGSGVDLTTNFWPGCSLSSLSKRPGNALELSKAPSKGIMHDKVGVFFYGAGGESRLLTASWNFTAAASSQQWNVLAEFHHRGLALAYSNELRQMLNGYFHSNPDKARAPHDNASFRTTNGPADGWVRFAPYPSNKADGDNAQAQIVARIAQATNRIVFALNKQTRAAVTDQLIAACDRGVDVHGVIPLSDRQTSADASYEQYQRMLAATNYATTNRIQLHEALYKCTSATDFDPGTSDLVHCKYMVIDPFGASPWVVHGSANWTLTALATTNTPTSNDENVLFIPDGGVARAFLAQFSAMTGFPIVEPESGVRISVAAGGTGGGPRLQFTVPDEEGWTNALVGTADLRTWAPDWSVPLGPGTNSIEVADDFPKMFFRIERTAVGGRKGAGLPVASEEVPVPLTNGAALEVTLSQTQISAVGEGEREYSVSAEVVNSSGLDIVQSGWSIVPADGREEGFAGVVAEDGASLAVVPAAEDGGRAFDLTYAVVAGAGAEAVSNSAVCRLTVLDPRLVDFETLGSFSYPTNYLRDEASGEIDYVGVATNLNGMDWKFFNVRRSETNVLGVYSARVRHSSRTLPGILESYGTFAGIGTVSVNYRLFSSSGFVSFVVEIQESESEDWIVVGEERRVEAGGDIGSQVHAVDVARSGKMKVRLRTTGGSGNVLNVDDLTIRPYGELVPYLVVDGAPAAAIGREYVLAFTVANGAGAPREWTEYGVSLTEGEGAAPAFEEVDGDLRLAFTPTTNDAGKTFMATGTVSIYGGQYAYSTNWTFAVAAGPEFELRNASPEGRTTLFTNEILDVWTTNVVVGGVACTNRDLYDAEWTAYPAFATNTVNQYNRFRIGNGLTVADLGNHELSMTITDKTNGLATVRTLHFLVLGSEAKDPRHLDFEEFAETNGEPRTATLSGAEWGMSNVCAGWSRDDRVIGTTAARFRCPSNGEPAFLESAADFMGVGYVEFSCAGYGGAVGGTVGILVKTNGGEFSAVGEAAVPSGDLARHRVYVGAEPDVPVGVRLAVAGEPGRLIDVDEMRIGEYRPEERLLVEGELHVQAADGFDLRFVATNVAAGVTNQGLEVLRDGWDVTQYEGGEPLYSLATAKEVGGTTDDLAVKVWLSNGFQLETNVVLMVDPYERAAIDGFRVGNLTVLAMAGWSNVVFAVTNLDDAAQPANWVWARTNVHAADGAQEVSLPGWDEPPNAGRHALFYGIRTP